VRKAVLESYNKLHKIVLQLVLDDPLCQRFMMVPGVGAIVALSFEVAVDNPMRFTRSRIVSAHSGLTQRRHQSGTSIDFADHVTKMDDINARGALCEAATTVIDRMRSRKSGSQSTPRWRETDSNPRSPVGTAFFQRPSPNPATANQPGSQNRILTDRQGLVSSPGVQGSIRSRLAAAPHHRRDNEPFEQHDGCRGADNDGLHRRGYAVPHRCVPAAGIVLVIGIVA
jgi:transposase IS116/IS110/IS902 family protein